MQLKNIEIVNYRSINKLKIPFKNNINILIGPNGCGKTNILDAINNCFEAFLINSNSVQVSDFWFGKKDKKITITAEIDHNQRLYKIVYEFSKPNQYNINLKNYSNLIGYYKYIPSDRFFRTSRLGIRDSRDRLRNRFDKRYDDSREILYSYFDMLTNSPYNLEDISKVISDIYPDLTELHFSVDTQHDTAELIAIINDFAIPLHLLASGVQQLISMIAELYYSKNSIILIDEPELHMNPQMIMSLSNLIKRSSMENRNQFIIGTHSPALISTLNDNIIPLEYKKTKEGYSTCLSEVIPEEFLDKSILKAGE